MLHTCYTHVTHFVALVLHSNYLNINNLYYYFKNVTKKYIILRNFCYKKVNFKVKKIYINLVAPLRYKKSLSA